MDSQELEKRPPLPTTLRVSDGRPIWEPPILDYSEFLGDEYDHLSQAVMSYTKGVKARATELLICIFVVPDPARWVNTER